MRGLTVTIVISIKYARPSNKSIVKLGKKFKSEITIDTSNLSSLCCFTVAKGCLAVIIPSMRACRSLPWGICRNHRAWRSWPPPTTT
eukprot:1177428-Prorocentrum_minimum.AAC.2